MLCSWAVGFSTSSSSIKKNPNPRAFFFFFFLPFLCSSSRSNRRRRTMADDSVLRYSLVLLGAVVLGIGICTLSFKKMIATYVFGLLAISGLVLPDWEFFDRDFSQWLSPMPARDPSTPASRPARFRIYPMRLVLFTIIYGFGLYKWWNFITN